MKGLLSKATVAGLSTLLIGGMSFAAIGNDHTGYNSENNASVEATNTASIMVGNDIDLDNDVDGTMRTGLNDSNYNTGSGSVESGDAEADISATNKVNDVKVSLSSDAMDSAMPSVQNSTTGADSTNNAWVTVDNTLDIAVTNAADVDNDVDLFAGTGLNDSNYNTGNGHVSSGDAEVKVNLSTTVNSSDVSTH